MVLCLEAALLQPQLSQVLTLLLPWPLHAGTASTSLAPPADAGMSENFFFDFFPTLWTFLNVHLPHLWAALQPLHILRTCPELHATHLAALAPWLGRLRNPTLLPIQLLGLAVGLDGAQRLLAQPAPRTVYWGYSFLYFGLMNATSLVCHALTPRGTALWRLFAALDVAATGASSLCLLFQQACSWAELSGSSGSEGSGSSTGGRSGSSSSRAAVPGAAAAALALPPTLQPPNSIAGARSLCLHTFLLALVAALAGAWFSIPWANEALYLGTTAAAACAVALVMHVARQSASARQLRYYGVALAGAALMVNALPADRLLCAAFGPMFGTVHCLFLGCAVAFWGCYGFVTGDALGLGCSSRGEVKRE